MLNIQQSITTDETEFNWESDADFVASLRNNEDFVGWLWFTSGLSISSLTAKGLRKAFDTYTWVNDNEFPL